MEKAEEGSDDGRRRERSISRSILVGVLNVIPAIIIVCIFPLFVLWEDVDYGNLTALSFGLSAIFYVLVDALFLYAPLINEETKCVMLDNRLKIAAIVLRSFGDLRYVQKIYLHTKDGLKSHSLKQIAMSIAIDTLCILPVPQVVILIFLPKMRSLRSLKIMKFLNSLILLQYLPRLYPIYKMCKQVNKDTVLNSRLVLFYEVIQIPKWFAIAVNIVGYILASHVLGAFWYLFSIQREIDCWGYACRIENGCEFSTSCDKNTFRNITLLNNLCPINPPDATIFDFGIFLHALQSGIQASTNFPEKFLQCFLWGLRNLSSFASNLDTSAYGWENFFVVIIAIIGLVLFMYLLGHTQIFMQEAADKSSRILQKIDIIKPKITYMVSEYGLTNYFVGEIGRGIQQILEEDESFVVQNFVVQNIFSVLQPSLQQEIKGILCNRVTLSNVFNIKITWDAILHPKTMGEELKEIIEHVEQVSYNGGSYIIREGEPLDMIFFIALGNVVTYSTKYDGSSGSSTTIELKKLEWYGEKDLIPWAARSSSNLSNLPISTITVKSHKQVHIFAIKATDLKNIASKFPGILKTEVHHSTDSTGQMEIDVENS